MPRAEPADGGGDAARDSWGLPGVEAIPGPAAVAVVAASKLAVVRDLAAWCRRQQLPTVEEDELVKFAHSCDYDLDRAKKCVTEFHACRKNTPELFSGWDTELSNMRSILDVILVALVPRKTPQNCRVLVNSLQTSSTSNYVFADVCKALLMVMETIFLTEPTLDGLVVVHDMGQASFSHFMKFGWSLPQKFSNYTQEALPLKQSTMHLVHCSSFVDKGLKMMSHIGKKEDRDKLRVHPGKDYSALHAEIPRDCLPSDLGGTQPSIAELHEATVRRLAAFRDVFKQRLP
ncbi:alpha-tocopherol transfer protein-like [Thrips palmi]|uniref:Alpha-tocopherol transfer protein-like n=1 Tax=Thrips palmi TaxID=161013 RepID=A0A6P8YA68_THRPL|nr:alpha-tocopherol transfer protein-like [Thrips palmi]